MANIDRMRGNSPSGDREHVLKAMLLTPTVPSQVERFLWGVQYVPDSVIFATQATKIGLLDPSTDPVALGWIPKARPEDYDHYVADAERMRELLTTLTEKYKHSGIETSPPDNRRAMERNRFLYQADEMDELYDLKQKVRVCALGEQFPASHREFRIGFSRTDVGRWKTIRDVIIHMTWVEEGVYYDTVVNQLRQYNAHVFRNVDPAQVAATPLSDFEDGYFLVPNYRCKDFIDSDYSRMGETFFQGQDYTALVSWLLHTYHSRSSGHFLELHDLALIGVLGADVGAIIAHELTHSVEQVVRKANPRYYWDFRARAVEILYRMSTDKNVNFLRRGYFKTEGQFIENDYEALTSTLEFVYGENPERQLQILEQEAPEWHGLFLEFMGEVERIAFAA